jgi:hypothetical protein
MLVLKTSLVSAKSSIRDALKEVKASNDNFLVAEVQGRTSLLKQSQLRRVASTSDDSQMLGEVRQDFGEQILVVPQKTLSQFRIVAKSGQLSGDIKGLMASLNQRLALINVSGAASFLVSASEDHLVDYHCEKNDHPYVPPPPWKEGMKCWCKSEIIREG